MKNLLILINLLVTIFTLNSCQKSNDKNTHFPDKTTIKCDTEQATNDFNEGKRYFDTLQDNYKALEYFQKSLDIRQFCLSDTSFELFRTYYNIGNAHHTIGNHIAATNHYEKALIIIKQHDKPELLAKTYQQIGMSLGFSGEDDHAIEMLLKSIEGLVDSSEIAESWKQIGICYYRKQDSIRALKNTFEAINIYKKQALFKDLGDCYNNLNVIYQQIGNLKEAYRTIDQSLKYYQMAYHQNKEPDTYFRMGNTHIELGHWYLKNSEHNKALQSYQNALIIFNKVRETVSLTYFSEAQKGIGDIYRGMKNYNQALKNYDTAIAIFETQYANPLSIINALEGKAQTLSDQKDFAKAYPIYCQLDTLYNQVNYKFQDEKSKFNLAARAFPMYEKAILTALKCFDETKDSTFYNAACGFMDRSKATVLKQNITDSRAKKFVGISDKLMRKESELKSHIAYRQKQADENLNDITRQALFYAKDKFQCFIKDLETQYPNYYKLKYAIHPLSISDIQKQLPKDMLFISYFWGDSTLIRCVITKTTSRFYTQPITNQLDSAVTQFTADLKNSNTKTDEHQNGHYLYQQLLEQPLKDFNAQGLFKRLRIIPDGKLNYLPFSALTETPITNWEEKRNQKIPFLVRKYAFSYDYFADSLKNQVVAGNFIGFGVDYTSSLFKELKNSKLQVLPNAKEELESITNIFSGDKWFNDKATKENFLKHTQNVGVVHIVAHTATDDKSPLEFGIALSPNKDTNSLLKGRDLLAFQMTAQLVTLSACSTGEGELKRGEGVMSLAKAFEYIGCKSVMMSLWSIPDGPTSNIMKVFYQNLKNKDDKDIAFQKAQLHYLNNKDPESSDFAMPNKWAACVLTGSIAPVEINESFNYFWLIGIIALFVGGFWFLFKNRQSSEDF